jgi:hypothetical protein
MLWPTLALSGRMKGIMAIDAVLSRIFFIIFLLPSMDCHFVLIILINAQTVHNCVFNERKAKPFLRMQCAAISSFFFASRSKAAMSPDHWRLMHLGRFNHSAHYRPGPLFNIQADFSA